MTSRDFCYWLQGKLEIDGEPRALTKEQVALIARHLNMVFKHEIDPSFGDQAHQDVLQQIHDGPNGTVTSDDLQRAHEPAPPTEGPPTEISEEEIRRILEDTARRMEGEAPFRGHFHRPGRDLLLKC